MKRLIPFTILLIGILALTWSAAPNESDAAPEWQSYAPPLWILGPIQGADGTEKNVLTNLDKMEEYGIPITAFHFDSPDWQTCTGNLQFRYSDTVLDRMRAKNIRGLFWVVPLIGLECPEYQVALANNYFVKDEKGQVVVTNNFVGHGSWIDFENPDAVAYWHSLLDNLRARVGDVLGGFYTDSVRPDKRDQVIAYGEAYALDLLNYTRAHVSDGDVVFKRYGVNTPGDAWLRQYAHVAYVNDLATDFSGMKTGIERVFATSLLMPMPYNEFSGFHKTAPDSETYIRRMHWGAFQPLMENVPLTKQPWSPSYSPQVMRAYRYYATLHAELAPYLHSYDQAASETKTPIFRSTNSSSYQAQLGNEFFVKYVTEYADSVPIKLPPGKWINYWDESQVIKGPRILSLSVPWGREPIFIARGAIIPMYVKSALTKHGTNQSAGALTVNVYPTKHSTFRYHDITNGWLTLDVTKKNKRFALCTLDAVPSEPIIWRLGSVKKKPTSVTAENGAVGVNTAWGSALPELSSDAAVGGSTGGWYYDANAKRLIVKISTLGTNCPAP